MFSVLNTTALFALLGLLVPLLIHLWERRRGRRVLVGSLRWLEAAEEQRVSRLRFTDFWRFLLRALIVSLFVLLLARPIWRTEKKGEATAARWLLVEPAALRDARLKPVLDSLREQGVAVRQLAPGFPDAAEAAAGDSANYWSLLRDLARRTGRPDTVAVWARPFLHRLGGERPALPFVPEWTPLPEEEPVNFPVAAWRQGQNLRLLTAESAAEGTGFTWRELPEAPAQDTLTITPGPKLTAAIAFDPALEPDKEVLAAALRAAAGFTGTAIDIQALPAGEWLDSLSCQWLFWLSESPLPMMESKPVGQIVRYRPEMPGGNAFFKMTEKDYVLQQPLSGGDRPLAGGDRLPRELIGLLLEPLIHYPQERDRRYLAEEQLRTNPEKIKPAAAGVEEPGRDLREPLWMLLVLLFGVERLWRSSANR